MNQDEGRAGRTPRLTPNPSRQGLLRRLLGGLRPPTPGSGLVVPAAGGLAADPTRLGRYRLLHRLGQGGMGVVFAAEDESLGRRVALKTIAESDDAARRRFHREARAAAGVNHPNVCQVYEIGEDSGQLFIAMELLTGEPLADRLARGPMPVVAAIALGRGMLSALGALHASGVVHRDLKPSNVFLTQHGVKLLDFGLARPLPSDLTTSLETTAADLTRSGLIVGTPRYMAPEQVVGGVLDARADLFATAAILYEAVAGRPAFLGTNLVEVLAATLHEQPPALAGDSAVIELDRVLRRALAKRPSERFASAAEMAAELEAVVAPGAGPSVARPLTRLVVLPFRLLRADPEIDFLCFALADAVSASLTGLSSLVLRSSAAAARFASESPDLKAIAAQADVDLVLMGTLLRAGEQIRVSTQLVEAPAGTLVSSHTLQAPLGDVFRLQDELAQRIVESLSGPLGGVSKPRRDVPASPRAYEFYLRANELAREWSQIAVARDLYLQCVELDAGFAPAWAKLGRCHRLVAKYFGDRPQENLQLAEQAFRRALELDPDLPAAHKLYAHHEAERGRARQAMARLLGLARRNRNDAEVFAGLVHACRYCGLIEASEAAHRETLRLDPHAWTSVVFTWWAQGHVERILSDTTDAADVEIRALALHAVGRTPEAIEVMANATTRALPPVILTVCRDFVGFFEGRLDAALALQRTIALHSDPEALFMYGCCEARAGAIESALETIGRAVDSGYTVPLALTQHPWLAAVRGPGLDAVVVRAENGCAEAERTFREAGGEALLGL